MTTSPTDAAHRAQIAELLALAVPLWILHLQELDQASHWDTWRRWILLAQREETGVFKEDVFFKGKSGERAAAFNAMAKSIAALAFVPGGVRLFGRHWEARRSNGERRMDNGED